MREKDRNRTVFISVLIIAFLGGTCRILASAPTMSDFVNSEYYLNLGLEGAELEKACYVLLQMNIDLREYDPDIEIRSDNLDIPVPKGGRYSEEIEAIRPLLRLYDTLSELAFLPSDENENPQGYEITNFIDNFDSDLTIEEFMLEARDSVSELAEQKKPQFESELKQRISEINKSLEEIEDDPPYVDLLDVGVNEENNPSELITNAKDPDMADKEPHGNEETPTENQDTNSEVDETTGLSEEKTSVHTPAAIADVAVTQEEVAVTEKEKNEDENDCGDKKKENDPWDWDEDKNEAADDSEKKGWDWMGWILDKFGF